MRINCLLLYTISRLPGSNLIWTRVVKNFFENQPRKWYVTNHRFHQHKYMYLWMVVLFTFPRLRSLFIVSAPTPLEWNESLRVCSRIHVHEHVQCNYEIFVFLRTYLNKRKKISVTLKYTCISYNIDFVIKLAKNKWKIG